MVVWNDYDHWHAQDFEDEIAASVQDDKASGQEEIDSGYEGQAEIDVSNNAS